MITQEQLVMEVEERSLVRVGAEVLLRLEYVDGGVVRYTRADPANRIVAGAAVTMAPILALNIPDETA
jgi:hypothetical protein